LDAHVGRAVFQNVLRDAMAGKTRLLVTHALHFLPQVDYIYVLSDGKIIERGTYTELMENGHQFSAFVREFGSKDAEGEQSKEESTPTDEKIEDDPKKKKFTTGAGLMQAEERNTGAVDAAVYKQYSEAARGGLILPFLAFSLVMVQGSTVMSSYWCVGGSGCV
jgi:ABC-type multidrug transport system ATPase subunit